MTAIVLAASGLVAIAPAASAALSTGCQAVDDDGAYTGSDIYWQQVSGGFTFSTGETLKITYSDPTQTPTTAHIMAGTSAASGVPASFSSKTSTSTFPATLTYTLDQDYTYVKFSIDDGNVGMVFECGIAQAITFANPGDQELPTGTVSLTATSDSGLTVSLASSTTSVCTVSGTTLTLKTEGTCTITASQAGSGDYLAADDVVRSFTVSKASQTITFANPGSKALSVGSFTASSSADSGLTVSLASSTGSVCSMTGSTVGLLATGTCTLIASQAGNSNYNAATNVERSFSVTASSGGGGGGGGGAQAAPAPAAPAPTATGTTTTAVLTWTPDSDREKYVSSGQGVEISAEALAPTGGKRAVDDGDAFALVDGDDIELDIKGLADDSTLTVSFTFADPDRPECSIESQEIEVGSGTTLTESSIPFDPADQCLGEWTMTLEGQTSSSTAFEFTTPIALAAKQSVTETLDAKGSYFFKGRSDAFHTKSPRKLTRLANSVPEKADVTIAVTGVSVSLKGKKANTSLAKKRCEQIEEFMREALPGRTVTFESAAVGARKRGGDVSTDALLSRNKRGKPLTTVSVAYTTLK
ncbi:MAG: hypothetical protein GKR84_03780 [Candidatus Nanopelagicales bacterium]|nr:hypothetical protein [Candidatus Nanopelagicales bacterium]